MGRFALPLAALVLAAASSGCSKDSAAATRGSDPGAPHGDCGHAACGNNFFVDASPDGACAVGATCTLVLKLVATGDYHINDEYPYKFTANDTPGVEFLGTGPAGKNVFSKAASNWQKLDEKTGKMTVTFRAADKNAKTISGTMKLSICTAANCQLEQAQISATVTAK